MKNSRSERQELGLSFSSFQITSRNKRLRFELVTRIPPGHEAAFVNSVRSTVTCYIRSRLAWQGKRMQSKIIQIAGLAFTIPYAVLIVWIYATEPRTFKEVATSAEVAVGTYQVNQEKFNSALDLFRREQFRAARDEWQRADPAQGDARTQFYIAYSFYREGWGRLYHDQQSFKQGLEAVNRAIALSSASPLVVDDPNLRMHSAAELKAELEQIGRAHV